MWKNILEQLKEYPARIKVVRLMIEHGIGITERGSLVVGPVEIADLALAKAAGVDRRVVRKTVEYLLSDETLKKIFTGLRPAGALLSPIAKVLGYSVLEIRADPSAVGVLAKIASIVSEEGIAIRQASAEDPDLFPEPRLILVLERHPSGDAIRKMLNVPTVKSVTAY
ncbi:MAG: amino acid-binding protein [Thaumarchaeota archaeon]|jgi:predicted regulator of amino acid metabolism with ACT domain|nr:amino acid-binding protein [Candidatus Terraquivivens yellowstonensis]MCL7388122.1 amino acid-binding protein [Candidatus Terraquivivens yellowstonensis]MCL7392769.1 amino acid-binding protein [Candidatus Terraquivivens yellowstonensis]MCL7395698.1 amino acid-binding protein [Candidatus Terraquivivens yellowstonensis]MCL7397576.1 amino acid-binding protein [Candidatus Terraquivivens yellowstonensis]